MRIAIAGPDQILIDSVNGTFEDITLTLPLIGLTIETQGGNDTVIVEELEPGVGGILTIDAGSGTGDTLDITRNDNLTITNTDVTLLLNSFSIANFERLKFTGGNVTTTIDTSGFDGSAQIFKNGLPLWTEQGPQASAGTEIFSPVTGAINSVVTHPTNANKIFIGSVAGGVWKTTDGGVNWEVLTDDLPSLSIGSLALSPLDNSGATITGMTDDSDLVLVAGTGVFSSNRTGGASEGLYISGDGGKTWAIVGDVTFGDLTVTKVIGIDQLSSGKHVFYVSTFDTDVDSNGLDDNGGLFRVEVNFDESSATTKIDSLTITKISGSGGEPNLPKGNYTDLAYDPGHALSGKPARLYAIGLSPNEAASANGIYRFDFSTSTWTNVHTPFITGNDANSNGLDDFYDNGTNTRTDDLFRGKIALAPSTEHVNATIFAAFIGPHANTPSTAPVPNGSGLNDIVRSQDHGATWTALTPPTSLDGTTTNDLNPSGAGDLHFSLGVDPNNPLIAYVGGDAEPRNGASGITGNAGRIFRIDPADTAGTTWVQLVGSFANNTAPHPDSRGFAFDQAGNVLQVDDGGLYRLSNPYTGALAWQSLAGNMRTTESLHFAYDYLNDVIFTGTQDNGTSLQVPGSLAWTEIAGGDGAFQEAAFFDTDSDGEVDQVARYIMSNNYRFVYRGLWDADNMPVADPLSPVPGYAPPGLENMRLASAPGGAHLSGLTNTLDQMLAGIMPPAGPAGDTSGPFWEIPLAVNRFNPTDLVIGTFGIYESRENTATPATEGSLNTIQTVFPGPAAGTLQLLFTQGVTSLVYGGMQGTTEMPDVIVAAVGNTVAYRQNFGTQMATVNGPPIGSALILDITVDRDNWRTVYAVSGQQVFRTLDITATDGMGNAAVVWTEIGSNFAGNLLDLEFLKDDTTDILVVGGQKGAFALANPETAMNAAAARWLEIGLGLPNAPVTEVKYYDLDVPGSDETISAADRLIVSTLGRGMFTLSNLSVENLTGVAPLTGFVPQFIGSNGDDHYRVALDPNNSEFVDVFDVNLSASDPILHANRDSVPALVFLTGAGNDRLEVQQHVLLTPFRRGLRPGPIVARPLLVAMSSPSRWWNSNRRKWSI